MTLKDKLLVRWRGDPDPEIDPENPPDRPLSRHELNEIADNYGENETASKPLPPIDIGPL